MGCWSSHIPVPQGQHQGCGATHIPPPHGISPLPHHWPLSPTQLGLWGSCPPPPYSQSGRLRYFRMVLTFSAMQCWGREHPPRQPPAPLHPAQPPRTLLHTLGHPHPAMDTPPGILFCTLGTPQPTLGGRPCPYPGCPHPCPPPARGTHQFLHVDQPIQEGLAAFVQEGQIWGASSG